MQTKGVATETVRPSCPKCESRSVIVRKDKSILCRRCGYDSRSGSND